MRLEPGGVLHNVGLVREELKMRRDETKSHQTYAGAEPRKKRPLFREVIPQIADRFCFDRCHRSDMSAYWICRAYDHWNAAAQSVCLCHGGDQ